MPTSTRAPCHVPFGAEARQRADVGGARDGEAAAGSLGDDGPGDRVLGSRFDGGGGQQRVGRCRAGCVLDRPATTVGSPWVSVPVLSNATVRTAASRSRCAPPLMSTPRRAAVASAATIDTGVEITSAHGHATTSSTSAR